ncbi:MAG: hypothetical protein WBR15_04905 [Gammaproteobacteria bacterium]
MNDSRLSDALHIPGKFRRKVAKVAALLFTGALGLLCVVPAVHADSELGEYINDYVVYSPYVVQGQSEVELRASAYRDSSLVLDDLNGQVLSVAHSFTDWWKTELYLGEYLQIPRQPSNLVAYELENTFQLASPGKYWADPGFLFSYEFATHSAEPNELEFGPLFEKRSGRFVQRLNLIWEKEIGTGADHGYEFRSGYSISYQIRPWFAPGLEAYFRPGSNTSPGTNAYQLGPVLYGEYAYGAGNELEYSAGVVFGMNPHAPDMTFMMRLEYEFF